MNVRLRLAWWISICSLGVLGASMPPDALREVRRIAIQHNGREKPFDSFARETLRSVTGSSRIGSDDPVATVIAIMAEPERWQAKPLISVPFVPLRDALGMDRKATHISYDELVATRKLMRRLPPIVQRQQRDEKLSMLEQETMDAFERFVAFSNLIEHKLALVPPASPMDRVWTRIDEAAGYPESSQAALQQSWKTFISSARSESAPAISASSRELAVALRSLNPSAYPASWRLDLEVFYNQAAPFGIARWLYLAAVLFLLIGGVFHGQEVGVPPPSATGLPRPPSCAGSPGSVAGMVALVAGFAVHASGIGMRVILGGRPPVSNFFETMLWLPFVAVVLALVFERIYRVRYFGLSAGILAAIMLSLIDYVPLDSAIEPVVAVLRSNLWLTIHVLTIVASYGALALATVLAHLYSCTYLARRGREESLAPLDLFLYRVIQVGVVLLAAGIMLGAVWANASWGRYWGWDPKETWALITLLWFLAVLHGRFAGWLRGIGVALSTIGGFFLLLMTYYGVSFYLVGLHSYAGGHAKPIPTLLIGYLIAEVAFLLVVGCSALRRRLSHADDAV